MSSPATRATPLFFDEKLLGTRDPKTAAVSQSAWVENLEMGTHAAIQLAQNLLSEMRGNAPTKDTMRALYQRVLTLSGAHESHWSIANFAKAISTPLTEARQLTESWYLGCFNPESPDAGRTQVCPTQVAVSELLSKLRSLVAVDEDGNRVIDLIATSEPFVDRYNRSCKPYQVFDTPAEPFNSGGPLAWMTGKK
jgi:hypothetical protein